MNSDELLLLARVREMARSGAAATARLRAGVTQVELAATVGVTPAAVCRWESGSRRPRGAAALRYARILEALERASHA